MFFVNLPASVVAARPRLAELALAHGVNPEIGLDAFALDELDGAWHRELAGRFSRLGLACGVHLPFAGLHPGAPDPLILAATRERLARAAGVARIYEPRHLVGHADCTESGLGADAAAGIERAATTWRGLLDAWPGHPPLHLENTYETDPEPVAELVAAVDRAGVGALLDVGHWHSFGRGSERGDAARWIEVLAPAHLHLHDNDGAGDHHLGLGQGTIDWRELAGLLKNRGLVPTVTFEPHTEEDFAATLEFVHERPEVLSGLV